MEFNTVQGVWGRNLRKVGLAVDIYALLTKRHVKIYISGYWPSTETKSRSIKTQKITWRISSQENAYGRMDVRTDITSTKFSRLNGLPYFLGMDAPLARFATPNLF